MRLYVETADTAAKATTFYVDGAQMERKPYATTYVDGSQPGCRWNIQAYATQSTRDDSSRAGGRWVALAGPCRPNNDIYVTLLGGFGMAGLQNQTQPWSNSPGSFFQNSKVRDRTLTLSFFVKKEDLYSSGPPDLRPLHELRQQIIDIIHPDKTHGSEPFLLEYESTEANRKLYIHARYDGGLDGSWDVRNQWVNAFPLRLLAVDPFWFEDNQEVTLLGIVTSFPNTPQRSDIQARINNEWIQLVDSNGNQVEDFANAIQQAPDGSIYIGAGVDNAAGVALWPRGLTKWDGYQFTNLGACSTINDIAVAPNGMVYITGTFTTVRGVAANRVAMYNPTTDTWSAMGTGLNGAGDTIVVGPNGQVYVGGGFTTAGGVACYYIARWDGFQWRTVGQYSGVSQDVRALALANDGRTIYMGGIFLQSQGGVVTYNGVASIDTVTNLISQMGYGLLVSAGNTGVQGIAVGMDGTVYACGSFLISGAPSATPILRVARWSGGQIWLPMGSGLGGTALAIATGKNGEIYVGGQFTSLGNGQRVDAFVKWNHETWVSMEIFENAAASDVIVHSNGDIYLGIGGKRVPKLTSVTNPGTATVFPLLYYKDAGIIRYIGNNKTGQAIYLDLTVFDDEEIFFDFARGKVTSTVRGDVSYAILPGSEIRSIYCLPGENTFSVLVTNDVNGIMQLRLQPQHWSADAVVDADEL